MKLSCRLPIIFHLKIIIVLLLLFFFFLSRNFYTVVFLRFSASDSFDQPEGEKLLCTCENNKGTCSNGTCRGDYCFYSWVQGWEERGCFPKDLYREQCSGSLKGLFVHCCTETKCNAFVTPSPNICQYSKWNIVLLHLNITSIQFESSQELFATFWLLDR